MPVWIALLRGVNLVGARRVKMESLRDLCTSLEFEGARTYLASGNVVFRSRQRSPAQVAERLAAGIAKQFGFAADVVLRSPAELAAAEAANPFAARDGINPSHLLVLFLGRQPAEAIATRVRALPSHPDEVELRGREVFIHYPNGQGQATLSFSALDRALGMPATGRNLHTVRGLIDLARQL